MRTGRPPKPLAQHKLHGTLNVTRHKARIEREPRPEAVGDMRPPAALIGEGRKEWARLLVEFRALGLVTKIDRAALATYCAAYGAFWEAERAVRKTGGRVVKGPDGKLRMNPWVGVQKAAAETMRGIDSRFGMTPSDRARLGRQPPPDALREPTGKVPADPTDALTAFLAADPRRKDARPN